MLLKRLIFIALLLWSVSVYAQTNDDNREIMMQCALQKISQLNDYISLMSNKSIDMTARNKYRQAALNLFIGNGEPFDEQGIYNSGVEIIVTSSNQNKPTRSLVKNYLARLVNLQCPNIELQSSEFYMMDLSELHHISENKYVCGVCYKQKFVGYRDGRPMYSDCTKRTNVYITLEHTIDGLNYIVLLGDISAIETD